MAWLTPPVLWFEIIVVVLVSWCVYRFKTRPGSRIVALRSWLAYIAISIALVVGILLYALYGADKSPVDGKWIAFAANSVFVFGCVVQFVRPLWPRPMLWAVIAGLLLLHGIAGWAVLSTFGRIPLLWYVPVNLAEIWAALIAVQVACRTTLPPMRS